MWAGAAGDLGEAVARPVDRRRRQQLRRRARRRAGRSSTWRPRNVGAGGSMAIGADRIPGRRSGAAGDNSVRTCLPAMRSCPRSRGPRGAPRPGVPRPRRSGSRDDRVLIRGAVRDQKPPGVYLAERPRPADDAPHGASTSPSASRRWSSSRSRSCSRPTRTRRASTSSTPTRASSGCRSPAGSPTRCASCSAGRVAAPTRPRCCWRWARWRRSARGRCTPTRPAARARRSWRRAPR